MEVAWTEYFRYRAALRGFDLDRIEEIVEHSTERYVDTATDRPIAVGRCGKTLVLVPYETGNEVITPITVHGPHADRSHSAFRPGGSFMNKPRLVYFEKEDVLHLVVTEGPEAQSVELSPNVTAELNDKGELIGIEILQASSFLRDTILESAQAKLLAVGSHGSEP